MTSVKKAPHSHGHGLGHSHSHGHGHAHAHDSLGNIGFAFVLNLTFSSIQLIGGLTIGSMAIVAGAIHDFGDAVSLGTAWVLERFANRSRDEKFNFGYRRFSLLSAFVAGLVISLGSIFILLEAIERFQNPESPPGGPLVALAFLGLTVNAVAAWRLAHGETQNERMLTWHSIEDLASWSVVLIGGLIQLYFSTPWLDPALAIALALFVLFNVLRHLKHTTYLFLQGRPGDFDESLFVSEVRAIEGIEDIDQLAVWSLDGRHNVLSARLHIHSMRDPLMIEDVKEKVRKIASRQNTVRTTLETCLAEEANHES